MAGAGIAAAMLFAQVGMVPVPARAATPLMTCAEAGEISWPDGITKTATNTGWEATIDYSECSGSAVDAGEPVPIRMTTAGTETVECEGAATDHEGIGVLVWSDGTKSIVMEGTANAGMSDNTGLGIFPSSIVSGRFEGKKINEKVVVMYSGDSCPGQTAATLTGTFALS